jgi:hypothetical protein
MKVKVPVKPDMIENKASIFPNNSQLMDNAALGGL